MKTFRISYDVPPTRGIFMVDYAAESEEKARLSFNLCMNGENVRLRDIKQIDQAGSVILNTEREQDG